MRPCIKQHLIDPEICIRCNTCEATCPVGAITHDDRNYVVDADKCNLCMACISPCPTGSIDNWRTMPRVKAYSARRAARLGRTAGRTVAPTQLAAEGVGAERRRPRSSRSRRRAGRSDDWRDGVQQRRLRRHAAALVGRARRTPTCTARRRPRSRSPPPSPATCASPRSASEYDTHHIVLDFGAMPFPVLEGQSIGIVPPGTDANGRAHHARQYSIASPRNGERPGYNNVSLTIKRVLEDHARQAGARRRQQLHVRPEGRRQGAGDRARSAPAS